MMDSPLNPKPASPAPVWGFEEWIDSLAREGWMRVVESLLPALEWLAEMHDRNEVHGGIHPGVLMPDTDGQLQAAAFTQRIAGPYLAARAYLAPELLSSRAETPTKQSDVYSMTAVLYRALTGQSPVAAQRRQERGEVSVPRSPDYPEQLARLIELGMHLDPNCRLATARALVEQVEALRRSIPGVGSAAGSGSVETCRENLRDAIQRQRAAGGFSVGSNQESAIGDQKQRKEGFRPVPPSTPKRLASNLTVGRSVQIELDRIVQGGSTGWELEFLNLGSLGLEWDPENNRIVGTPTVAGEHYVQFRLHPVDCSGVPDLERQIAVTINPDPDSLWRVLPSDQSDRFWKPDLDSDSGQYCFTEAEIHAASRRGRSHEHEGLFRDDDFEVGRHDATGWNLIAVGDGAGSASYSRRGSQIACRVAVEALGRWLSGDRLNLLTEAVRIAVEMGSEKELRGQVYSWFAGAALEARKAIAAEAEAFPGEASIRDFATTLLLAAVRQVGSKWVVITMSIGDGGIGLYRAGSEVRVLCTPDSGEFSGQTVFLTSPAALSTGEAIASRQHIAVVSDFTALVLMTDGITDPKFPTESSLADLTCWEGFWLDLSAVARFEEPGVGGRLLEWMRFRSPGNHDDRTLVVLVPKVPVQPAASESEAIQ